MGLTVPRTPWNVGRNEPKELGKVLTRKRHSTPKSFGSISPSKQGLKSTVSPTSIVAPRLFRV